MTPRKVIGARIGIIGGLDRAEAHWPPTKRRSGAGMKISTDIYFSLDGGAVIVTSTKCSPESQSVKP